MTSWKTSVRTPVILLMISLRREIVARRDLRKRVVCQKHTLKNGPN